MSPFPWGIEASSLVNILTELPTSQKARGMHQVLIKVTSIHHIFLEFTLTVARTAGGIFFSLGGKLESETLHVP
jgi:hypothetical protein